ncbi:MAG: hypothetical protein ABUK11_03440 [Mariprofundaceae bacterium]
MRIAAGLFIGFQTIIVLYEVRLLRVVNIVESLASGGDIGLHQPAHLIIKNNMELSSRELA